jgi:hypothetical protein
MRLLILTALKSSAGCHPIRDYHACIVKSRNSSRKYRPQPLQNESSENIPETEKSMIGSRGRYGSIPRTNVKPRVQKIVFSTLQRGLSCLPL